LEDGGIIGKLSDTRKHIMIKNRFIAEETQNRFFKFDPYELNKSLIE
jgi:hypothetical protein